MKFRLSIATGLACLAMVATLAVKSQAVPPDHRTLFTITAPLEVPGHVLTPGSYIFKLLGDQMNTLQILNKSNGSVVATLFTIPEEVSQPAIRAKLALAESRQDNPEMIRAWFYPGMNTGWEFVYPRENRPGRKLAQVIYGEILPAGK